MCSITKIANIFCNHVSVCFPAVWCHSSRFATYLPSHTADKEASRLNTGTLVFSGSWQEKPREVRPTRRTLMGHPGEPAGSRSQHFSPVSNNPLQIKLCAESRCKVSHHPVLKLHFQQVENRQKYILTCNKVQRGRGSQNIQMALCG